MRLPEGVVQPEPTRKSKRVSDLSSLIQTSLNDPQTNDFTDTRPVTEGEAVIIRRLTGQNADGWLHLIDGTAIRHILKKHAYDFLPMTPAEIARIPEITKNAEEITYQGKDERGRDVIRYETKENSHEYAFVVEELREGRGKLSVRTAYKSKRSKSEGTGATPGVPAVP